MTASGYTGSSGGGGAGAVTSVAGRTGVVVLTKADVALSNVDNTADTAKPVSTAQAAADALKANIASPTFTGTVSGVTATMVGLGNVTNTSDAAKPVSTAQQTALNLKADLAGPTFTGTVSGITATMVGLGNVTNTSDANKPVSTAQQTALNLKANLASPAFSGTVTGITSSMVGLGSVDNTADTAKPVSTAQQTALNLKANLASPTFTGTVSGVTAAMVGLGSVDNTADTAKPVSTAQAAAITNALSLLGVWTPASQGLVGATADPGADPQGGTVMATAGLLLGVRFPVVSPTVTNIVMHMVSGGGTLTAGQCFAGLYSDAGNLLSSSVDQASSWGSGGLKTIALAAPQSVTPGTFVKVCWFFNGTTGPSISRTGNIANVLANVGLSSPNFRWFTANTALTTALPGTIGAMTSFITTYWVGLT